MGSLQRSVSPPYCELPDCDWSLIIQRHRIHPGRDGGKYVLGNVISLCPTHHALADRNIISQAKLYEIIAHRITLPDPTPMDIEREAEAQRQRRLRDWAALLTAGLIEERPSE